MAATNAVHGWDQRIFVGNEASWLTRVLPAAANGIQVMNLDFGEASGVGNVRARKDKTLGRAMTLGFVEGRVDPIPFTLEKPVMTRAAAATAPEESPFFKSAGFSETIGASVVYAIDTADPASLWLLSVLGNGGTLSQEGEHGLGGVVKQLGFTGGDSELMMKVAGAFARKNWLGQLIGTLADASDTSLAADTAADMYRFGPGYYQTEAEVIEATSVDQAGNSATVTRGINSTTAAAHSAKPVFPYSPTPSPVGVAAISEANCAVTLDSVTTRCTKFSIDITTGVDHLPGETGSKYAQGLKLVRMDVQASLEMVLTREMVALLGKANQRKSVALSIACGSGAGGQVTFSLPYCEVAGFPVPAPSNDISIVSVPIRVRGSSGNDSITITFA